MSKPAYEDYPDFNEFLDGINKDIEIDAQFEQNLVYKPSEVLYKVDDLAYEEALIKYQEDKLEELKQTVFDEFPTPIAYNFYRFERGSDNENQRRDFLRDTWESIIFLIYSIVVGEFRCSKLSMDGTDIKMREILSDSLDAKLSIVSKLLKLAADKGFELSSVNIISLDLIEKLRELNKLRNGFSHTGAMSEEQARKFILANQGDVLSVLQDCKRLSDVKLLRFNRTEGKLSQIRCEVFKGHSMNRTYKVFYLENENLSKCLKYLHPKNILINIDDAFFSISPFFHFRLTDSGHQTKLCCYKKKKGEASEQKFIYEVIGDALEIDLEGNEFISVIDEIRCLLPDLSGKGGGKSS
ncbi:MAG TPA: hypothetical protein V6C95_12675 [Coleofasciculaceae cyanobacterium]